MPSAILISVDQLPELLRVSAVVAIEPALLRRLSASFTFWAARPVLLSGGCTGGCANGAEHIVGRIETKKVGKSD